MEQFLHILSIIFWGLIVLSVLVYIHEGGHFIAARILGLRVKEFFIGLPCRARLSFTSKRTGTAYGVTPLLMGGYTLVCGMDGASPDCLAPALAYVYRKGTTTLSECARALKVPEEMAESALFTLVDWGSIEEVNGSFQTVARDAHMRTPYDKGHNFSEKGSTKAGEAHPFTENPEAALAAERSHTYQKLGFWGRAFVLINGVFINVFAGFLAMVFVFSCLGVQQAQNTPQIGAVTPQSPAAVAGLQTGDVIVSVGDSEVNTWTALANELGACMQAGTPFSIVYTHEGQTRSATITPLSGEEKIGISASVQTIRLNPWDALRYSFASVGTTAAAIAQLFNPAHFSAIISQSSSVIGISVMASEAANQGIASLLLLAAAVSLSLGFMNLLPIPPLDGGKIVIEAIGAVTKKPVPLKVQTIISYIGIALFILLFFVLLRQDIVHFVLRG